MMKNHSVIFIEHSDYHNYQRLDKPTKSYFSFKNFIYKLFLQITELPIRIFSSFVPPLVGEKRVYVDFVGPCFAVFILGFILNYGHSYKHPLAVLHTSPLFSLALYSTIMPSFCFLLSKLGKSELGPLEIISLLGYGLYGHIFTILTCYLIDNEMSTSLFFFLMAIFGGLSGFRIVIILLLTIPKPAARLLVCSFVTILHILFLIFIHFAYMHRTFRYGNSSIHV